jgi:2-dehydropantoate 2-reductase
MYPNGVDCATGVHRAILFFSESANRFFMANITIIGPGAIGLCVGAALLDGGHKVNLIGRKKIDEFKLIKEGRLIKQYQLDNEDSTPVEWLLICVKSHQIESAKEAILSRVNANTKIAIIQNGVEHIDNINAIGLFDNLLEVMIDLPAKRLSATEVTFREPAIGFVRDNSLGQEFSGLFAASFIKVDTTPDIKTKLWRKLCINAPTGAILCLTGQPMKVFHQPGIADIGRRIIREVINVGRKEGVNLGDEIVEELITSFLNSPPESTNSMFEDFKAGQPTEWVARNAVLVKLGKKHGVPTPISDLLVPLLAAQK